MRDNSITLNSLNPAGRRFIEFVAVVTSGDSAKLRSHIRDNHTPVADEKALYDWYLDIFRETGGLRVHNVYTSQTHFVVVLMRGKLNDVLYMVKMKVEDDAPNRIADLQFQMVEG